MVGEGIYGNMGTKSEWSAFCSGFNSVFTPGSVQPFQRDLLGFVSTATAADALREDWNRLQRDSKVTLGKLSRVSGERQPLPIAS